MKHRFVLASSIVLLVLGITVFFGIQIPRIVINNNVDIFIPPTDPSKIAYDRMKEVYGSQKILDVALEAIDGTILSVPTLRLIQELTEEIEQLDGVEDVKSLTNADYIEGTSDGMKVAPLLEEFEGTREEIDLLKAKLESWKEMYQRQLISEDLRSTQILVTLDKDASTDEQEEVYRKIYNLVGERSKGLVRSYIAGDPVVVVLIEEYMKSDLLRLVPFVVLVVILVLFFSFHSLEGVLLPLISVLISTIWTVGLMAVTNTYFSLLSTCLPILMIAVGSAYGIHVVSHYDESILPGTLFGGLVRHIGVPLFLAALTTLIGFLSLAWTPIIPLRHFAFFSAFGVAISFLVSITFIPAVLYLKRRGGAEHPSGFRGKESKKESPLVRMHRSLAHHRGRILVGIVLVGIGSLVGLSLLSVDNSMIENFQKDSEIRRADAFIRESFGGTKVFSVVVTGEEDGDLTDPEVLKAMDDLTGYLYREFPEVGKVVSFTEFIKRMNLVLHSDAMTGDFYEIPYDPAKYGMESRDELKDLVSQYLLLYSGNLSDFADNGLEPKEARMIVQLRSTNMEPVDRISRAIRSYAQQRFPQGYTVTIAGYSDLENALTHLVTGSQIKSLGSSLGIVFGIIAFTYHSWVAGLFGIIPLGFAILINFGVMGFFGIRLDMVTAMVASLAVGIGVDYTIHFLAAYKRERSREEDLEEVTRRVYTSSGKAILVNALSVGAGFLVLVFSNFTSLRYIGSLVALTMVTSSFAALALLPILLNTVRPTFMQGKPSSGGAGR
ncbi:MAG: hypothetical protein Kow009_10660 [Spirochaetales bacterium]